jgi:hypothetical protein
MTTCLTPISDEAKEFVKTAIVGELKTIVVLYAATIDKLHSLRADQKTYLDDQKLLVETQRSVIADMKLVLSRVSVMSPEQLEEISTAAQQPTQ